MEMKELIARINFLYKKKNEEGLTEEEEKENQILRREYIDAVKGNVRAQLNTVKRVPSKKLN
ncbi:DUF896 domain-containing protein [Clostridium hydrogenum]|uniref:DUF896 domain-containing protein n=1 Tax=Clostridium hydrogenum TaxID=2855764 RepID=UPI001F30E2DF|nr:DUF896 domain-containing protein [Clostridium hydrogenum]